MEPKIPYEGAIVEIKDSDLIVIRFNSDFVEQFDHTAYMVEFLHSRTSFSRMHISIDMAIDIFGIDFLMPKSALIREKPILDVALDRNQNLIYNKQQQLKWFNKRLDYYQRQAVTNVLRADYLNPYIIHGPPGNFEK